MTLSLLTSASSNGEHRFKLYYIDDTGNTESILLSNVKEGKSTYLVGFDSVGKRHLETKVVALVNLTTLNKLPSDFVRELPLAEFHERQPAQGKDGWGVSASYSNTSDTYVMYFTKSGAVGISNPGLLMEYLSDGSVTLAGDSEGQFITYGHDSVLAVITPAERRCEIGDGLLKMLGYQYTTKAALTRNNIEVVWGPCLQEVTMWNPDQMKNDY